MITEIENNTVKTYILSADEMEQIQDYIDDLNDEIDILNNINDKEIVVNVNELRNQIQRKSTSGI